MLGQEASGAFIGGLRYGEGTMYTRNAGDRRLFWQGPSIGFDAGADGDRTMMLVYNLTSTDAIFERFVGVDGSAYLVGGFGITALNFYGVTVVQIRTGVGARLGVNVGYLKFTPAAHGIHFKSGTHSKPWRFIPNFAMRPQRWQCNVVSPARYSPFSREKPWSSKSSISFWAS